VVVLAERASLAGRSRASVLVANRVDGAQLETGLLIARDVYGNVDTQLDGRGALLLGLGIGLGMGLLVALRSMFRSED
jgi:hypothetical protein